MGIFRSILDIQPSKRVKRILILDYIRGFLVLLILYHHASAPLNGLVLQFHMPALFILSGYTEFLLDRTRNFWSYVKSRFIRLIVPYFLFEIGNLIIFICLYVVNGQKDFSFSEALVSIVTCINNSYMGLYGRLWFFPAMFFCNIFSYVIKIIIAHNKAPVMVLFVVIMFSLTYVTSYLIPFRLPFAIDIAFLATAFFLIGHLCGKYIQQYLNEKNQHKDIWLLIGFTALCAVSNIIADPACLMYVNRYRDYPFMIIVALSGSALVFVLAKMLAPVLQKIRFINNIIIWYSVNSLATFPIHLVIRVLCSAVLGKFGLNNWAVLLACMLILTVPTVNIITKYLPFMVGNFDSFDKRR